MEKTRGQKSRATVPLRQLWLEHSRAKAARQGKHTVEKRKDAYSMLQSAEGCDVGGDEVSDEWEPEEPITSPCDSVTVSEG